jgi:hypothetical protein
MGSALDASMQKPGRPGSDPSLKGYPRRFPDLAAAATGSSNASSIGASPANAATAEGHDLLGDFRTG